MSEYIGSITLASISDGADGSTYSVSSSEGKILKFYNLSSGNISFSPETIGFWVEERLSDKSTRLVPGTDYDTDIEILGSSKFKHLWSFLKSLKVTQGSKKIELLDLIRQIDDVTNTVYFNIFKLIDENLDIDFSAREDLESDFAELTSLISSENIYFVFKAFSIGSPDKDSPEDKRLIIKLPVSCEFGTTIDMASFALTSSAIQAAVGSSRMKFDVGGLHILNGGFDISNDNVIGTDENGNIIYEKLLSYDNDAKSLYIKGNGTFTGTIKATAGEFRGDVTALNLKTDKGTIGGWNITEKGLTSFANEGIEPEIQLLSNGKIIAQNIELGQNVTLNGKIAIGNNVFIQSGNDIILQAGKTELYENGRMVLGDEGNQIILDAKSSSIFCDNDTWKITPTWAEFRNVSVSGKIVSTVFEANKVQAVGGSMIFKPSFQVTDQKAPNGVTELILDAAEEDFSKDVANPGVISEGYYIGVLQEGVLLDYLQIQSVDKDNKKIILGKKLSEDVDAVLILGQNNSCVIGVDSGDSDIGILAKRRGISVSNVNFDTLSSTVQAYLGDLEGLDGGNAKGTGLYAENVYLKGSLVSNAEDRKKAGINTLNKANFSQDIYSSDTKDNSHIIFWAGADSLESNDIQNAPFQVSENGTLYAQKGIFKGSIITEADIYGSKIYAAKLYGWDGKSVVDKANAALSIYDAYYGINFYKTEDTKEINILSIGSNGFSVGEGDNRKTFTSINFNSNIPSVSFTAKEFITENGTKLEDGSLVLDQSKINLQNNSILLTTSSANNGLFIEQGTTTIQSSQLIINNKMYLGNKKKLEYRELDNGYYDLYIIE